MNESFVVREGKRLRRGHTTGSCAAAAAKACAWMLEQGQALEVVEIDTPKGVKLRLNLEQVSLEAGQARCAVIKDGGDDPDVTDGMAIFAQLSSREDDQIVIEGGLGIGRITKEGFWGLPGQAAVNPVPRQMIQDSIRQVSNQGWNVLIEAPDGVAIAKRTFNENLGILGGISIIGTTGIVEPMSEEAWVQAITMEIDAHQRAGATEMVLYLGNYSKQLVDELGLEAPKVKISNFIGEVLLYCHAQGIQKITLAGHLGKLTKLALGAFNTHSKTCDIRMESFIYYLALAGAPTDLCHRVSLCTSSEEATKLVMAEGWESIFAAMRQGCVERIKKYVKDPAWPVEVILYSMDFGILGADNRKHKGEA